MNDLSSSSRRPSDTLNTKRQQQEPEDLVPSTEARPGAPLWDDGSGFSFLHLGVVFCQSRARMNDRILEAIRGGARRSMVARRSSVDGNTLQTHEAAGNT